jgi:TRAP-type mannitol/chloroaromatic compound transport system permease small subunit
MKKLLKVIDSISKWTGQTSHWLATILMLLVTLEVFMRYVFTRPSNWNYETSIMVGAALYALSWTYSHLIKGHTRVDVFYSRLSVRGRAVVDTIGSLIFFFPLTIILSLTAVQWAINSIKNHEKSAQTIWYPPLAPLRIIVAIGIIFFTVQGLAHFIRDFYTMIKGKAYD